VKLIVLLFFIFGVSCAIYLFITYFIFNFNKLKKINWIAFGVSAFVGLSLVTLIGIAVYRGSKAPDTWCKTIHITNSYPPEKLESAMDYFEKGNYEYDLGKCNDAIESYSQAIKLNTNYIQAYNNKAYTYMRMSEFDEALSELNKVLSIDPNYTNALMNRGDIYRDRLNNKPAAIKDYEKIISITGGRETVCGHLVMAKYFNDKNWLTYLKVPFEVYKCQKGR